MFIPGDPRRHRGGVLPGGERHRGLGGDGHPDPGSQAGSPRLRDAALQVPSHHQPC